MASSHPNAANTRKKRKQFDCGLFGLLEHDEEGAFDSNAALEAPLGLHEYVLLNHENCTRAQMCFLDCGAETSFDSKQTDGPYAQFKCDQCDGKTFDRKRARMVSVHMWVFFEKGVTLLV
jgi:hypothetical protein